MKKIIAILAVTASGLFGQQIQQIPYEEFQRMNQEQQRNIILLQESINNNYELQKQSDELEELKQEIENIKFINGSSFDF